MEKNKKKKLFHTIKITGAVNGFESLLREMDVVSLVSYETLHPPHKETPHKAQLPEASAEASQLT